MCFGVSSAPHAPIARQRADRTVPKRRVTRFP
jgi:hypothetical protein